MENLKKQFVVNYNKSVSYYNDKDYVSFFIYIRRSIESLCKLMVFLIIEDNDLFQELISGKKSIIFDKILQCYSVNTNDCKSPKRGRSFIDLFRNSFFYVHKDIFKEHTDQDKKNIKHSIDYACQSFHQWYSVSSELGSHSDDSKLNYSIQASSCATFFSSFFDKLTSSDFLAYLSNSYINELDSFSFSEQTELSLMGKRIDSNDSPNIKFSFKDNSQTLNNLTKNVVNHKSLNVVVNNNESSLTISKTDVKSNVKWDIDESLMDDDQIDLIEMTIDQSMLVEGGAGSGKSIIAAHKAEQLANQGKDVVLITFTKSLSKFMGLGSNNRINYKFYYYHQWKSQPNKFADYIIVDEIQDFTKDEILEFIHATKKHYFFFGDSAQSIYKNFGKKTLLIDEISELTGLAVLKLFNNYRLPRSIAKITQEYVGVNVCPYEEKTYKSNEKSLPHFIYMSSFDKQILELVNIIKNSWDKSIGILVPNNSLVIEIYKKVQVLNIPCELKYRNLISEKDSIDTLDFSTTNPKIMTYHSAKGLQFDIVIIPNYEGAPDNESRKALYVAMTRTLHELYVLYSTPLLNFPLSIVPSKLYLTN